MSYILCHQCTLHCLYKSLYFVYMYMYIHVYVYTCIYMLASSPGCTPCTRNYCTRNKLISLTCEGELRDEATHTFMHIFTRTLTSHMVYHTTSQVQCTCIETQQYPLPCPTATTWYTQTQTYMYLSYYLQVYMYLHVYT